MYYDGCFMETSKRERRLRVPGVDLNPGRRVEPLILPKVRPKNGDPGRIWGS